MITIPNPERGCGHLVEGGIYLTSPPASPDGILPAFVELDPPIPYLEPQFRGWTIINGLQWELVMRPGYKAQPGGLIRNLGRWLHHTSRNGDELVEAMDMGEGWQRHLALLIKSEGLDTAQDPDEAQASLNFGARRTNPWAWSHDLLMWVGEANYAKPWDFIQESLVLGASKRIPPATMPLIVPGITRLWLIHPKACPVGEPVEGKAREYGPGVIGYVYLDRVVYIKPKHRKVPERIENLERLGQLTIVKAADPSPPPPVLDPGQSRLPEEVLDILTEGEEEDPDDVLGTAPDREAEVGDPRAVPLGDLDEGGLSKEEADRHHLEALRRLHDVEPPEDWEPDEPDTMGPEIDDEGGMSEYRHPIQNEEPEVPDDWDQEG